MNKINFGCGQGKLSGWINVDLDVSCHPDVVADLVKQLPFANATVDFIHSEDFISQLTLAQGYQFLRECRRILRPSGVMRLLTPDLERFARKYLQEPDWLVATWNTHVGVPLRTGSACEVLNLGLRIGGQFQYDKGTFARVADECGFAAVEASFRHSTHPELRDLDLRAPDESISMYFECHPAPGANDHDGGHDWT
ncbi:MAG TPA: methyltransferase domain-containing protein [Gammaproteobacteria bacterium]|nr:methyltransferase domain-containing protein [Gammaproteobacteria bacterium]